MSDAAPYKNKNTAYNQTATPKTNIIYALIVWLIGCSFFLMDYFIRVSPSLITSQLMTTFNVGAFAIGGLSAIYLYPYVVLQPFAGGLIDRHGPYRLLVLGAMLAALGSLIFSAAQHLSLLYLGRFITGLSCALSFVGTLKLITNWFAKKYFALLAGLTQAFGMLGAFLGDAPLAHLYQKLGWRQTTLACAVILFIIACLILLIVRDQPKGYQADLAEMSPLAKRGQVKLLPDIFQLLLKKPIWLNAIYNGCLYAPMAAFAGLWGVPFLSVDEKISTIYAAHQISAIFIGVAVGAPLCGMAANYIKRLTVMRGCAITSLILTLIIIYGDNIFSWGSIPVTIIYSILFVYGFFAGGIIPSYDFSIDHSPQKQNATAIGLTNMASLGIGALLMPAIGIILDNMQQKTIRHIFNLHDYHYSLVLLPIVMLIACIISLCLKE